MTYKNCNSLLPHVSFGSATLQTYIGHNKHDKIKYVYCVDTICNWANKPVEMQ